MFWRKISSSSSFWVFKLPELTSFKSLLGHETIENSFALLLNDVNSGTLNSQKDPKAKDGAFSMKILHFALKCTK